MQRRGWTAAAGTAACWRARCGWGTRPASPGQALGARAPPQTSAMPQHPQPQGWMAVHMAAPVSLQRLKPRAQHSLQLLQRAAQRRRLPMAGSTALVAAQRRHSPAWQRGAPGRRVPETARMRHHSRPCEPYLSSL